MLHTGLHIEDRSLRAGKEISVIIIDKCNYLTAKGQEWHLQWESNPLLQFSLKHFFLRLFFLFSGPKIPQL